MGNAGLLYGTWGEDFPRDINTSIIYISPNGMRPMLGFATIHMHPPARLYPD
jgi:hypothetical protein